MIEGSASLFFFVGNTDTHIFYGWGGGESKEKKQRPNATSPAVSAGRVRISHKKKHHV